MHATLPSDSIDGFESAETADDLHDTALDRAEALAERHYDEMYGEQCEACAIDSPAEGPWGPHLSLRQEYVAFEEAIKQAEERLDCIEKEILARARGAYSEAWAEAAVDPDECAVCGDDALVVDYMGCGHHGRGDDCPARQ